MDATIFSLCASYAKLTLQDLRAEIVQVEYNKFRKELERLEA